MPKYTIFRSFTAFLLLFSFHEIGVAGTTTSATDTCFMTCLEDTQCPFSVNTWSDESPCMKACDAKCASPNAAAPAPAAPAKATTPNATGTSPAASQLCQTAVADMTSNCNADFTSVDSNAGSGASVNSADPCASLTGAGNDLGSQIQDSMKDCRSYITACISACGKNDKCDEVNSIYSMMNSDYQRVMAQSQQASGSCNQTMSQLSNAMSSMMSSLTGNNTAAQQAAALAAMQQCATNPGAAGCGGYTTFCSNPANSGTSMCVNMGNNGQATGTTVTTGVSGNADASALGSNPDLGALLNNPTQYATPSPTQAPKLGVIPSNGQGGAGGLGNTPAAAAKKAGSGGVVRDAPKSLYGGLLNSQGGGGGVRSSPTSAPSDKKVFGEKFAAQAQPDFSKFAPKMAYDPKRGLASVGPGGRDGITGPESNLFDKVRNQYQFQSTKGTLLSQ